MVSRKGSYRIYVMLSQQPVATNKDVHLESILKRHIIAQWIGEDFLSNCVDFCIDELLSIGHGKGLGRSRSTPAQVQIHQALPNDR